MKLYTIKRREWLIQVLAKFVIFPSIPITFIEVKGIKCCSPSYWCGGSVLGRLILTVFHYFTPMVFIVSSATSVRTQRAVKAIPRDEAAPHCQNFTLEGLVFEGTDFCLLLFLLTFPFLSSLSFLMFLHRISCYPETNPSWILFFFPGAVVSLRNSLHFIPLPMLSSWVPATTWRLG